MLDLVRCQDDLRLILAGSDQLTSVNVKSYRAMRLANELDYHTMLTTPRQGRTGAAVLVLMPLAQGKNPNVTGPVLDWIFPIVSIEMPTINLLAQTGTLLSAEELGQIVMDILQIHADDLFGTFRIGNLAMEPEKEFVFPGCLSYRTNFTLVGKSTQTPRVKALQISIENGAALIYTATVGATIKYTLDGTFPANDQANNPSSKKYTAPVAVTSGQVIRACAYMTGMNQSEVRYFVVP